MPLTNGVVIGEEEKPGVGAGPSPHADPPTKGHGDVYWIAAAVVCDLIASRVRGPLDDGRLGSGGQPGRARPRGERDAPPTRMAASRPDLARERCHGVTPSPATAGPRGNARLRRSLREDGSPSRPNP